MKTFKKNNFLTKLLFIAFFVGMLVSKPSVIYGQNFIQIESILADACAGTQEGENEMVAFHTENSAINVADIRVDGASNALPHQTGKWPNNTNLFLGWILPGTANYDSAVAKIALINAAIVNCGKLIIPTGGTNGQGLIPAGKKGIIITSTDFSPFADDFSLLSDTLYVVFQKSGNTNGHFTNYGTSAMRYLRLHQISSGTNEDVSYNRSLLVTIAGTPGAEDGGGIRFTDAGVATYYNDGCQAPYIPLSPAWTPPASICQSAAALNLNTLLGATSTTGGTWSGTGVTGGSFNPAGLTGNISIKYLVGTAPCIDSAIHTINVIASAITTWTPPSSICQSAGALNLNTLLGATTTTGGTWSGTNVTGNNFNPAGLTGNISITYTAGTAPCASSEAHNIQVITSSIATWVAPATICETATPIDLNSLLSASTTTGGTWTGNGVTGNMFNPSGLNGNIAIKYEVGTAPCNSEETHNIQVLPSASAAWTAPTSICASASPIDLSLLITGDVGGTWSGDGVTGSIFTPTGLNGSIAISYFVNPSHTCPETITHSIEVSPTPSASWVAPAVICKTQATFDLNTLITGTTGGSWSGTGITSNIIDLTTIGSEVEVKYSVSNNGCSDELEATLHFSYVVADFNITPTSGLAPLNVTTTNLSQNAISYFWNFGNGSISTEENPEGVFPYEGAYFVWLKATSALGCVDSTFKMITVDESGDFIPNVFTPNGDNSNEEFYPIISKLTDNYNMMIFNRWGNLIFETHQQTGRWNGTYQGAKVPIGVYFYVISYSSRGKDTYYNGTVTVID